ncbi:MAG: sigma 54-interacting transcriptional regulator [Thermoanaerobaculales bacterium]|nr:sigma 54-interacting transcriptional regulator [Thermoanaerobaculales bacterium]
MALYTGFRVMEAFDGNWRDLQFEILVDLSLWVAGVRQEEDLVEGLLQRAVGTLDAGYGMVATLHSGEQPAVVRAVGLPFDFDSVVALFESDFLEELSRGRIVRCERDGVGAPPFELIAAPFIWRGTLIGVVILGDKETRDGRIPFSTNDARFLQSLAGLVATAVSTSRHVASVEKDKVRLEEENRVLRDVARREGFIGNSPPVDQMLDLVRRVAPTEVSVMLRGESGVGKERVAQLLHVSSDRADAPFVPLNCAALPESLLEAELFGIEEGVATGVTRRLGKIELAEGGTLFLDEVGDLSLSLQAKLLRVVQEREFERLGGRATIPVNLRLVTATNRDLEAMIEQGDFRSDLYYRLRVVVIQVPPLRERRTDIPLLARHFLEIYGERFGRPAVELDRAAVRALVNHSFPGNVRELENLIQAAVALAPEGGVISPQDLGLEVEKGQESDPGEETASLEEMERRHIERVLAGVGGNRQQAALILGIDRSTLYRKMLRFAPRDA